MSCPKWQAIKASFSTSESSRKQRERGGTDVVLEEKRRKRAFVHHNGFQEGKVSNDTGGGARKRG